MRPLVSADARISRCALQVPALGDKQNCRLPVVLRKVLHHAAHTISYAINQLCVLRYYKRYHLQDAVLIYDSNDEDKGKHRDLDIGCSACYQTTCGSTGQGQISFSDGIPYLRDMQGDM